MPIKRFEPPPWAGNAEAIAYWQSVETRTWETDSEAQAEEVCRTCGGAGFVRVLYTRKGIPVRRDEFEYVACPDPNCSERRKVAARKLGEVSASSQIPSEYAKMTFTQWEALVKKPVKPGKPHDMDRKRDAYGAARVFVEARNEGYWFTRADAAAVLKLPPDENVDNEAKLNSIVFAGAYGVGKTSLCCAIANALMQELITVVYVRASNYFLAIRDTYNAEKGETEGKVIRLYRDAPVLIIDEMMPTASAFEIEAMGQLIDYRVNNALPTLITTNVLTPEALTNNWGHLLGDRIAAGFHWFVIGGVELRKRKAAKESR